jgi:hypothetical protein
MKGARAATGGVAAAIKPKVAKKLYPSTGDYEY